MSATLFIPLHGTGELMLLAPYRSDNRQWLKDVCGNRANVAWNTADKTWYVSDFKQDTQALVETAFERFGELRYIWEQRVGTKKCDTKCVTATKPQCTCACGGINHQGWLPPDSFVVSNGHTIVLVGETQRNDITLKREPNDN